jgi:hypothetical protein
MDQRLLVRVWSFVDPEKRSDVGLFIESGWERLIFPRVWASLFFFSFLSGKATGPLIGQRHKIIGERRWREEKGGGEEERCGSGGDEGREA